jgi:hypothetical protein
LGNKIASLEYNQTKLQVNFNKKTTSFSNINLGTMMKKQMYNFSKLNNVYIAIKGLGCRKTPFHSILKLQAEN